MNYLDMIERTFGLALILVMLLAIQTTTIAQPVITEHDPPSLPSFLTSDAGTWDDRFAIDIDGEVKVMVSYHGELYIAGEFTQVNRVRTRNIAHWDGAEWHPIGNDSLDEISALAVDSSGNLYACQLDGLLAKVWMYSRAGGTWSRLGDDISGNIISVTCSDSAIYIGGKFTRDDNTSYYTTAVWDGASWKSMDNGLRSHIQARALSLVWNGKHLVAGGWFNIDGPDTLAQAIQWDGQRWQPLGRAQPGDLPYAGLVEFKGTLIAAYHRFQSFDTLFLNILAYDTIAHLWTILDSSSIGRFYSMIATDDSLYLGGYIYGGDTTISGVATFDPSSRRWSQFGQSITDGWVRTLAMLPEGLVIGRALNPSDIGGYLARWNGTEWTPFINSGTNGLSSSVSQLAVRGHDIYARGSFYRAGNIRSNGIARWDGSQWHRVPEIEGRVQSIGSDSTGVYAGIRTSSPPADTLDLLWNNDTSWSSLHLKARGSISAIVPHGNNLYVGGRFRQVNDSVSTDTSLFAIAYLDRLTGEWSWLDSRIQGRAKPQVYAVTVFGRNVVVGGTFDSINGIAANNVARWDGARWHPIGEGLNGTVHALEFTRDGKLYAGGRFLSTGQQPLEFLSLSYGNDWSAVGGSPNWPVHALAATGDELYIGGESFGCMRLDLKSNAWSKPGGGLSSTGSPAAYVNAIALDGEDLYLGGSFSLAGDKLSHNIAHWSPKTSSVGMVATPAAAAGFTTITPNPVQGVATITFSLPRDGDATLAIYSQPGMETGVIASGHFPAGKHTVQWEPDRLPSGIYYCQLQFEGRVVTQRIILLR